MIGDIIIANIIASGCLVLLIYMFDFNEKEPSWTLVRLYLLSILATFLFGKLKTILFMHYQWEFAPWVNNFIVAGFFEEILKLGVVMALAWRLCCFNDESDGIVYYLVVAAGFTVLENLGYSFQFVINPYLVGLQTGHMGMYREALQQIVVLRAVSGHIFINVVSGAFLGLARFRHKPILIAAGFLAAVLLHGLWNTMASTRYMGLFMMAFLIMDILIVIRVIRMSFYFKFMTRLKQRLKELIREGRETALNQDMLSLLEIIRDNLGALRAMEGDTMRKQAREITELLPPTIQGAVAEGNDSLAARLIRINGILGRDRKKTGGLFLLFLFLKFAVPGFFLLPVLIYLM